jgi:hypothetical protein
MKKDLADCAIAPILTPEDVGQITGNSDRWEKQERRSATHKRLSYCFNVNRTSLDHLLLGAKADVDKSVE